MTEREALVAPDGRVLGIRPAGYWDSLRERVKNEAPEDYAEWIRREWRIAPYQE